MFVLLRSQAGDYRDAIQLYTDSLMYQTVDTSLYLTLTLLYGRAECYYKVENYNGCIEVIESIIDYFLGL